MRNSLLLMNRVFFSSDRLDVKSIVKMSWQISPVTNSCEGNEIISRRLGKSFITNLLPEFLNAEPANAKDYNGNKDKNGNFNPCRNACFITYHVSNLKGLLLDLHVYRLWRVRRCNVFVIFIDKLVLCEGVLLAYVNIPSVWRVFDSAVGLTLWRRPWPNICVDSVVISCSSISSERAARLKISFLPIPWMNDSLFFSAYCLNSLYLISFPFKQIFLPSFFFWSVLELTFSRLFWRSSQFFIASACEKSWTTELDFKWLIMQLISFRENDCAQEVRSTNSKSVDKLFRKQTKLFQVELSPKTNLKLTMISSWSNFLERAPLNIWKLQALTNALNIFISKERIFVKIVKRVISINS